MNDLISSEPNVPAETQYDLGPSCSNLLSIVIVNWNVRDLLRQCLSSVYASYRDANSLQTIVIDNASSDGSVEMVRSEFPQVKLIENERNVGFTRANNQGIAIANGTYVMLLNPDTEILDDALAVMQDYLTSNPQVGAVGPQLLNADRSIQSSRRKFPTMKTAFVESTVLQARFSGSRLLKDYYFEGVPVSEVCEVDWLVGACLMIRGQALRQVGGLDERFFMYFEELDWCLRAKNAGWKTVYLPQAQVIHHYGQSSAKDVPYRHIFFSDSKCKYYAKHFGMLAGMSLRLFLLGTFVFQLAEEGLKYLLGHKRSLRKERIGVYFKVIKSGLRA